MDIQSAPLQITVKIPFANEGQDNFITKVFPSWTVLQLKEHLESSLSNKPNPSQQKLILSGRVLENHQILKDCFQTIPAGCSPVVHLVCARPQQNKTENQAFNPHNNENDGLRRRNVPQPENEIGTSSDTSSSSFDPNQHAQMMQNYQNYMQNYMYGWSPMIPGAAFPTNMNYPFPQFPYQMPLPTPVGTPNQPVMIPNQHPHHVAVLRVPHVIPDIPAGVPQPAAVVNADEGINRDVFDWLYVTVRLVLFLFVIFLYSSTTRFFSAFTILACLLLVNVFRDFRRWRRRNLPQNQQQRNQVDEEESGDEDGEERPQNAGDVRPNQNARQGFVSTVVNLVVGFVTSLVPENMAHVVAN